jgi:hypothetical protein
VRMGFITSTSKKLSSVNVVHTSPFLVSHLVAPQCVEGFFKICYMICHLYTRNQHVIHIYLHISPDMVSIHFVDQPLVGSFSILEFESHHLVAVQSPVGDKGSLLLINSMHVNLIVPREGAHEVEELVSRGGVNKYIHPGKGKAIFGTCFVQVGEVNPHPPFVVCLLH